jgi:hypothetical protein
MLSKHSMTELHPQSQGVTFLSLILLLKKLRKEGVDDHQLTLDSCKD